MVLTHLVCDECRYDLHGLAVCSRCPECGLAIVETIERARRDPPMPFGLAIARRVHLWSVALLLGTWWSGEAGLRVHRGEFGAICFGINLLLMAVGAIILRRSRPYHRATVLSWVLIAAQIAMPLFWSLLGPAYI